MTRTCATSPADPGRGAAAGLHFLARRPQADLGLRPPLLLLLHGMGSDEHDLFRLAGHFDPRFLVLSVRAPHPEHGQGQGQRWFAGNATAQGAAIDAAEAEVSRLALVQLINDAVMGFGADRRLVFLYGYGQGAAMAYSLALTAPHKLRGLVAVAGRVLPEVAPRAVAASRLGAITLLIQHGRRDALMPVEFGLAARDLFADLHVMLGFREYDAGHEISADMLRDAAAFLSAQLDPVKDADMRP